MIRFFICIALLFSPMSFAGDTSPLNKQIQSALARAFGSQVQVKESTPVAGNQLVEVLLNDGSTVHMTADASYLIYHDELFHLTADGAVNTTKARSNPRRLKQMSVIKPEGQVTFKAKGKEKASITVFTDIDCGYCQKLHKEIPELNELGVTVHYLGYPRSGVKNPRTGEYTASYRKLQAVWCADEPAKRMTEMKKIQERINRLSYQKANDGSKELVELQLKMAAWLKDAEGCKAPIAEHYQLGQQVGVRGTPALVSEAGELIPGYMPAKQLARRLGL